MELPTKVEQATRPTDRVIETLSTLAVLLDRSINDVQNLDDDFQTQAAQRLEAAVAESRAKIEERFNADIAELLSKWQTERTRLNAEIGRLSAAATQWEAERKRLNTEIERLAQLQAVTQAQAAKAIAAAKAAASAPGKSLAPAMSEGLAKEMERVEGLIKQISLLMEEPSTDLSTVIRKNVEKSELESYLKGIRFALNIR